MKLPDVLIFKLERNQDPTNNVEILPNVPLDMKKYIDDSLKDSNTEY